MKMTQSRPLLMPNGICERFEAVGILAVLIIDDPRDAPMLTRVLFESGIQGVELTLRTDRAMDALQEVQKTAPDMFVGVGTVLNADQLAEAKQNGAAFGVAPGYNREVVAAASRAEFPFAPGIATPSEIEGAYSQGCTVMKYFHAGGMGGIDYLKGINAPYKHLNLRYIPLGGLGPHNLRDYLELEEVIAVGGSWIAPQELIKTKDWSTIAENAKTASQIFRDVRGGL